VSVTVCYSRGVERSSSCSKGSSALMTSQGSGAWMTSWGSDETERGRTKRRSGGPLALVLSGGRPWAGCDGPWAVLFFFVGGFAVKMGYLFCW
jgi:hypothetical protein